MKAIRVPRAHPFYRDLVLVILAGLIASVAVVTLGYVVLNQVFR